MFNLVAGIIFLASPLLLAEFFSDKKRGFLTVIFFALAFQIAVAFFTQLFGIFYYQVIFWINFAGFCAVLGSYLFLKIKKPCLPAGRKKLFLFNLKSIDWIAFVVIILSVLTLYQVHYNYTGKTSMVLDNADNSHDVKNLKYEYPYFSDEWYSVSLTEGSIKYHSLPFRNLLNGGFFTNLEMFTHSFLAEIMLLLGLDPLTQYTVVSIAINSLIVILAYLFLRISNVSKLSSAICSLAILYITSAANLPGIWHLIPITLGILFSLIGFSFLEMGDTKMVFLSFFAVSLFYPLLAPFYGPAILIFLFYKVRELGENKLKIVGYSTAAIFIAVPVFVIVLLVSPLSGAVNYVLSRLFYISFTGSFIPQFNIFYIVPLPIILVSCFGIIPVLRNRKWMLWQLVVGLFYWILYLFIFYRVIIEFERLVFYVSIIICLIAGFGMEKLFDYVSGKYDKIGARIFKLAEAGIIIGFLLWIPFYTKGESWQKLILIDPGSHAVVNPRAVANTYLMQDDLRIFKDIKNKKFLSNLWKGTVIGVATGNYPFAVKPGTISLGNLNLPEIFSMLKCEDKLKIAKQNQIDYVYLDSAVDCPGFQKIDKSPEGFILYRADI